MANIKIKPHHFMDIIKLYGSGLEHFVPDTIMGHNFYKIGNEVLDNHEVLLQLTIDADDICTPCKMCHNHICIDTVSIFGYEWKNIYNQTLDKRVIKEICLDIHKEYTAKELCQLMLASHNCIYQIWLEEDDTVTKKRHDLFVLGAKKFLK